MTGEIIEDALKVPDHYKLDCPTDVLGLLEDCMDEREYVGFLRGNIVKYAVRLGKKDDAISNARKILAYAVRLVEALEQWEAER